jgi:hypothetical protein
MLLREITEALAWIWLKSRDAYLPPALPAIDSTSVRPVRISD